MKVYVDSELPTKSCNGCPYCKGVLVDAGRNKLFFCKANKGKMIKNLQKAFNKCIVKNEFQSLADYTKQVRKEVCEEIKEKIKTLIESKDFKLCNHEYANGYCYGLQYDLAKILDQIGEIK